MEKSLIETLKAEINLLRQQNERLIREVEYWKARYSETYEVLRSMSAPPLLVGTVVRIFPERKRAIVRNSNGIEFYVQVNPQIFSKLRAGDKVLLNQNTLAVVDVIASNRDYRAEIFEVIEKPKVTFDQIGGLSEQIEELKEVVETQLKNPEKFKSMGIEPPKGVLLYGPPGTGKTLLAKAVANESNATFISVVGSELARKYIGEGAALVRDLFAMAREKAPAIIFIDEIDAIASRREEGVSTGEREVFRTMLQLLAELDGFRPLEGVVVMGATNRLDVLDPALLRPGRFDRLIYVPLPNKEARKEIFKVHTKNMPTYKINYDLLAEMTEGLSGAQIKAICTEAGLIAIRENKKRVTMECFLKAIDKIKKKTELENRLNAPYYI
jgi:proteasome regulatory subunit